MVLGQGGEDRSSSRSKPVRPFLGNLGGEVRTIWRSEGRHAGAWKWLSGGGGAWEQEKPRVRPPRHDMLPMERPASTIFLCQKCCLEGGTQA